MWKEDGTGTALMMTRTRKIRMKNTKTETCQMEEFSRMKQFGAKFIRNSISILLHIISNSKVEMQNV